MTAVRRLVAAVLDAVDDVHPDSVRRAAARLLPIEAPLAGPGVVDDVVDEILGLGPLQRLLRDPQVSDVLVNGPGEVWVERAGVLRRSDVTFGSDAEVVAAVERVIAPLGLRLDRASPAVDARLADGSRLHAIVPPASVDGPVVAIRRFTQAVSDLDGLVVAGAIDIGGAGRLREAVRQRRNIIVSGGTGAGKTTLLNLLSREIPAGERVITVEDAAELDLDGHVVRLETRPPNAEGAGGIAADALVRHALRLRPDRIIVGEVRGPEALAMIQAMSTGHPGSMSTIHAGSPAEALDRLETLALMAAGGPEAASVRRQLRAAVEIVVQVVRIEGVRRVASISCVPEAGRGEPEVVWPC